MSLLRAIRGAGLGGAVAGLIAFSLVGLLGDLSDIGRYRTHLVTGTLAGILLGGIAGFASRLFARGPSLLTSISVVSGCAGLAHYNALALTVPYKKLPSYAPAIAASIVAGLFVAALGARRNRDKSPAHQDRHPPEKSG